MSPLCIPYLPLRNVPTCCLWIFLLFSSNFPLLSRPAYTMKESFVLFRLRSSLALQECLICFLVICPHLSMDGHLFWGNLDLIPGTSSFLRIPLWPYRESLNLGIPYVISRKTPSLRQIQSYFWEFLSALQEFPTVLLRKALLAQEVFSFHASSSPVLSGRSLCSL